MQTYFVIISSIFKADVYLGKGQIKIYQVFILNNIFLILPPNYCKKLISFYMYSVQFYISDSSALALNES